MLRRVPRGFAAQGKGCGMATFDGLYPRETIRMTPGRVAYCAAAMARRFTAEEAAALARFVREAEAAGRSALALAASREDRKRPLYGKLAKEKDTSLDAVASAIDGQVAGLARVYGEGHDTGDRARRVRAGFFPRGLHAVTNIGYADEIGEVGRILGLAKGELADDVRALGLGTLVALLEERAAELGAVLDREARTAPTHDEAVAAALVAERRMGELVMAILVHHAGDEPAASRRRAELLEPYELQQESMRQRFRRRVAVGEVDPDTGEVEEAEAAASGATASKKAREPAE